MLERIEVHVQEWTGVSGQGPFALDHRYCNVKRSKRGHVRCELLTHPKDHYHVGRGRTGRWYKWKDKA